MACFSIPDIALRGLSVALPRQTAHTSDIPWMTDRERDRFVRTVGIETRRLAPPEMTAADLCLGAAERLLHALAWNPGDLDAIVFVTQTPDRVIPGTATQLQQKLGAGTHTLCLDINQGCSGYVYGLSVLGALQSAGKLKKGLLLVGDTITHLLAPDDNATVPIFSDAGSATALEWQEGASPIHFNLQGDGKGFEAICMPSSTGDPFMRMQGLEVFNFALREVAPNVRELLAYAGLEAEAMDAYVFHQANLLLNESIRKKLGLPVEKVPYTLAEYGNTSCATIPVTLAQRLHEQLRSRKTRTLLSGFGVGLSWGSAILEMGPLVIPETLEL